MDASNIFDVVIENSFLTSMEMVMMLLKLLFDGNVIETFGIVGDNPVLMVLVNTRVLGP